MKTSHKVKQKKPCISWLVCCGCQCYWMEGLVRSCLWSGLSVFVTCLSLLFPYDTLFFCFLSFFFCFPSLPSFCPFPYPFFFSNITCFIPIGLTRPTLSSGIGLLCCAGRRGCLLPEVRFAVAVVLSGEIVCECVGEGKREGEEREEQKIRERIYGAFFGCQR